MRRTDHLRTSLATIGAVVTLTVVALVAPAGAQGSGGPPPREYGESGVDAGVVRVRAGSEWLPTGSANASGGGGSRCGTSSVTVVVEDDFAQPVNGEWRQFGSDGAVPFASEPVDLQASLPTVMRNFSPTGRWYAVMCDGVIGLVPEGGPAVTVAALAQEAVNQLDPPEPDLAIVPADLHFTQLPSWLAIEPAYWDADRRASAAAGRVQVVARAEPYQVIWNPGDGTGELAPCGQGTIWQPGLDESANECPYTYRRSSAGVAGAAFPLTATVSFEITVVTNAPGTYGPFTDVERTATLDVKVGEIQAVND